MPLLTVANISSSEIILSDVKKAFPSFSVAAGATVSNVKMLGSQLEAAGPLLKKLVDAGDITYTVAEDPSVPNDLELGQAAGALADGAVTTAKLAAGAVTLAKAKAFVSTVLTGTGSEQNVAHGLAVVPAAVLLVPMAGHDGAGAAGDLMPSLVEGVHTTTNVVATVSNGAKFKVLAWA